MDLPGDRFGDRPGSIGMAGFVEVKDMSVDRTGMGAINHRFWAANRCKS